MSTLVVALRIASLLVFAVPMLIADAGRRKAQASQRSHRDGGRAPVITNFAAFGLFLIALGVFSIDRQVFFALPLAIAGSAVAVAGMAVVLKARAELGAAWSLVAKGDENTGLVTTGLYRSVRHPIYLGLSILAAGQALAFGSWPAMLVVLGGVVPTFVWRARQEERHLGEVFGERYAAYQQRTAIISPRLL
jgi:protein-S-isoprenylcysteine O-methyltransferase Ste14